jgi:predicted kinase
MHLPQQLFMQMSGIPGSGKSTVANLLGRSLPNTIVINHDLLKSFFLDQSHPFDKSAKLAYSLDWILAEDFMKQGKSVILDSVCNYNETLENGTRLAEKYGFEYRYLECRCEDLEVVERRLKGRVGMRSQRMGVDVPPPDAGVVGDKEDKKVLFQRWFDNPSRPAGKAIVVDSSRTPEECVASILERLGGEDAAGKQVSGDAV